VDTTRIHMRAMKTMTLTITMNATAWTVASSVVAPAPTTPLPRLLELTDDKAAEAWVAEGLPRSSGPCDHWAGFPEGGWYHDALGYKRVDKCQGRGVTVYNPDSMLGGVISWSEIAELFRPRMQSLLF
jgi:hypothetical protein